MYPVDKHIKGTGKRVNKKSSKIHRTFLALPDKIYYNRPNFRK
ncbi:unknown [[Mannheimia] succiniciproducens MBEL55E]|uniref:Uncharacterized protein n=1 Tax=Mannheimia succiniciproducens (strain KCTC 0769BP / MBEL55E) TaxID=221988 RepID=Q65WA6_MANSM|nr:unknown [[Mannheimia] succiniciproducens MBEL55E]